MHSFQSPARRAFTISLVTAGKSGGVFSFTLQSRSWDAYPTLWKRDGAPPLHGDGIRSSGDLSSDDVASGKSIGQVFVAVDAR